MKLNEVSKVVEPNSLELFFPIRELSLQTGVNSVTLRAWERRYGLLKPIRTEKGHRLYSDTDVQRVKAIVSWINKGIAVSKVRALLDQESVTNDANISNEWSDQQAQLLTAIELYQEDKIDSLIQQNLSQYPIEAVIHYWLAPVLSELQNAQLKQEQKSYFISLLRQRITIRLMSQNKKKSKRRVLLTSLGEESSIWVWLQAAWCSDEGFYVVVIDTLESVEESPALIENIRPDFFISHVDKGFGLKQEMVMQKFQAFSIPIVLSGATTWLEENRREAPSGLAVFSDPFDAVRHVCESVSENQKLSRL